MWKCYVHVKILGMTGESVSGNKSRERTVIYVNYRGKGKA
jgi:hypothetical protein